MELATRLRLLRERTGVGQAKLAAATGVSVPTVSEWESGKKRPGGQRLSSVARFYGVSVDFLLSGGPQTRDGIAQNQDEEKLLRKFRESSPKMRRAVLDILSPDDPSGP